MYIIPHQMCVKGDIVQVPGSWSIMWHPSLEESRWSSLCGAIMVAMAELVAILHHGLTQGAQVLSGPQHKAITLKKIPCQPIFLTRSTLAPSSTGLALT